MAKTIQQGKDYGVTRQVRVTRPTWRLREDSGTVHDVTVTRVTPRPANLTREDKIKRVRDAAYGAAMARPAIQRRK